MDLFRRPLDAGGANYLVATDAAGEGINLQAVIDREQYRRLLPSYVRRFVTAAAPLIDLRVDAVYDCATPRPRLVRVRGPFAKLLAKSRVFSTYSIPAASVQAAAEGAEGIEP